MSRPSLPQRNLFAPVSPQKWQVEKGTRLESVWSKDFQESLGFIWEIFLRAASAKCPHLRDCGSNLNVFNSQFVFRFKDACNI